MENGEGGNVCRRIAHNEVNKMNRKSENASHEWSYLVVSSTHRSHCVNLVDNFPFIANDTYDEKTEKRRK